MSTQRQRIRLEAGLRTILLAVLLLLDGASTRAWAQNDGISFDRISEIPALVARGRLDPRHIPNPHWRADACNACHSAPPKLRDSNVVQLCNNCHNAMFDHSYIHPVGGKATDAMLARMPSSYRNALERDNGRLSCSTCHDVPAQCLSERRRERSRNPLFFRDGPFKTRTQQCYYCHEKQQYQRLNPHQQRTADGQIRAASCRLCHSEKLDALQAAQSIDELRLSKQSHLGRLCTRCHTWVPHPGTGLDFGANKPVANHLVKPPPQIASHMQRAAKDHNISLPLEPKTGRIYCATCHDPHARGVLSTANSPPRAEAPTESKARLRAAKICQLCHNK